ncbi:MAG: hypothetical protein WBR14_21620 [Candidatus Acidiferrum sp.]
MNKVQYPVPECIRTKCDQAKYARWLDAKACVHVRRDRKRLRKCTVAEYKAAIHAAVADGGNLDHYRGEELDWGLVSSYNNAAAVEGRVKYKRSFALLPTLDHTEDEHGQPRFVICSWRVNDMKSDMTGSEFRQLCARVLRHGGVQGGQKSLLQGRFE